MEHDLLTWLYDWFETYVSGYLEGEESAQTRLKHRYEHTLRVCSCTRTLVQALDLYVPDQRLAEAIALLHDTGRFEQFVRYGTFCDHVSVDHGALGLEILRAQGVFDRLDGRECPIVEQAIQYHGRRALPEDMPTEQRFFAQIIRDADKLDIYQVLIAHMHTYLAHPGVYQLNMEFSNEPYYTPEVIASVLEGTQVEHYKLTTINDMILAHLGWIYDIGFTVSLNIIQEKGYIEQMIALLPDHLQIQQIKQVLHDHVLQRITQSVK